MHYHSTGQSVFLGKNVHIKYCEITGTNNSIVAKARSGCEKDLRSQFVYFVNLWLAELRGTDILNLRDLKSYELLIFPQPSHKNSVIF